MRKTIFFILYTIIITTIVYFFIYNTKANMVEQAYKSELARIIKLTSLVVCPDSLEQLILYSQGKLNLSNEEVLVRYTKIKNNLQFIKNLYPEYVTYIYIYIFNDVNIVSFIIDADEEIEFLGKKYDTSNFELMLESLFTSEILIEQETSYDEEFDTYSISAYGPLYSKSKNHIASIGVDSSAESYYSILNKQKVLIFSLSLTLVLFSLLLPFSIIYLYEYFVSMKNIRFSKKIIRNRIKAMKKLKE